MHAGLSWILDAVLAALLLSCLLFCWRLERRLAALRSGQDGLRAAAQELNLAVSQAESAVRGLRAAAGDAGRELQSRIDEAKRLSERLAGPEAARNRAQRF